MAKADRIELPSTVLETAVLPLNYTLMNGGYVMRVRKLETAKPVATPRKHFAQHIGESVGIEPTGNGGESSVANLRYPYMLSPFPISTREPYDPVPA